MRIFCPCAFTYANKGDAVLVLALHDALRSRYGDDTEITFSSWDPVGDGPRYGLPFGPQPLVFDSGRWRRLRARTKRYWPLAPVAQTGCFVAAAMVLGRTGLARSAAVRRCLPRSWRWVFDQVHAADAVVAVPGGWLLAPRSSSLGYLTHVATLSVAVGMRRPVVLSPASIGPFVRPHRALAGWLLRHADVVVVREDRAGDPLVEERRRAGGTVLTAADMAFAFPILAAERPAAGPRLRVGISVRRHDFPMSPPEQRSDLWQRYLSAVAAVVDRLQVDHGAEVVLVPHSTGPFGHDPDTSRLVAERCAERDRLTVLDDDLDLDALQRLYASFDVFVGTRMHAAVIAARLGVPTVSIAYEHKGWALMEAMGLGAFVVDITAVDPDGLLHLVLDAHARGDEQRALVQDHEPALAHDATAWLATVDDLVGARHATPAAGTAAARPLAARLRGAARRIARAPVRRVRRQVRAWQLARRSDPIIERVRSEGLTYLDAPALIDLRDRVRELEDHATEGAVVETGCALGGSAIVLASAKAADRPMLVYDVFGMIPPPSDRDGDDVHARYDEIADGRSEGIAGARYYGYEPDLLGTVSDSFARLGVPADEHGVRFVPGLYEDTLHPDQPVALAHVDCDWHDSVIVCLERLWPRLVPGGVIVVDDYDHWSGCRSAVDEFFADRDDAEFQRRTRLHIVKTG